MLGKVDEGRNRTDSHGVFTSIECVSYGIKGFRPMQHLMHLLSSSTIF